MNSVISGKTYILLASLAFSGLVRKYRVLIKYQRLENKELTHKNQDTQLMPLFKWLYSEHKQPAEDGLPAHLRGQLGSLSQGWEHHGPSHSNCRPPRPSVQRQKEQLLAHKISAARFPSNSLRAQT